MSYCKCFQCEEESSEDSDPEEEIPLPPGVIPVQNEGRDQERIPVQTPSASRECLLDQESLIDRLRRPPQITVRKQLFAMTGWNVAIYPSMKVKGTREHYSVFAILEVRAVGKGEIQMKGVESGLYLAMSPKGKLYGEPDELRENTVWVETLSGAFFNYLNRKYAHLGWYLGIKKSGKPKRAHKTEYGQRAVQFLPRHPYPIS